MVLSSAFTVCTVHTFSWNGPFKDNCLPSHLQLSETLLLHNLCTFSSLPVTSLNVILISPHFSFLRVYPSLNLYPFPFILLLDLYPFAFNIPLLILSFPFHNPYLLYSCPFHIPLLVVSFPFHIPLFILSFPFHIPYIISYRAIIIAFLK